MIPSDVDVMRNFTNNVSFNLDLACNLYSRMSTVYLCDIKAPFAFVLLNKEH